MKEFPPDEQQDFHPHFNNAASSHFRVLVADDDENDRRLTIWHLGKAWPAERNMLVECAEDGAEALEKIRSNKYGLVVLDWDMPHRDGREVLRALREEGLRVPVVVVSGHPREHIAPDLEAMSATFVNKEGLDACSFGSAIAASMQLQEGRCSCGSSLKDPAASENRLGERTFNVGDGSAGEITP